VGYHSYVVVVVVVVLFGLGLLGVLLFRYFGVWVWAALFA